MNPKGARVERNRKNLVCDNLEFGEGKIFVKGHFIKFTFDEVGVIDSVVYLVIHSYYH